MKNYVVDEKNYSAVLLKVITGLKVHMINSEVTHKDYGFGKIQDVVEVAVPPYIGFVITFEGHKQGRYIPQVLEFEKADIYNEYSETLKAIHEMTVAENKRLKTATDEERMQAEIDKRNAEEAAKFEIKQIAKQEKIIQNLIDTKSKKIFADDDYYTTVGWIAAHCGTILAQVPEFAEDWFVKSFGIDAPKSIIDSKKKTSGGNAMKWTPSFSISLKKITSLPASVEKKIGNKKTINDTSMVFDLVENFGFKFGKDQDIDAIRKTIPADKLTYFQYGFTA